MDRLLKNLKLQHICSKQIVIIIVGALFGTLISLIVGIIIGEIEPSTTGYIELYNYTKNFIIVITIIILMIYGNIPNGYNIKMFMIFRGSRKGYYSSLILYFAIINTIISLLVTIGDIISSSFSIADKYNNGAVFLKKFVFYFLLFFTIILIFNTLFMIMNYYNELVLLGFIIMAIAFFPLKIYSYIINFLEIGNTILIFSLLVGISLVLILVGWDLVKNLDIIKVESISVDENREKKPFEGNYIQFIIANIKEIVMGVVMTVIINYFTKLVPLDLKTLILFVIGSLVWNSTIFLNEKRKLRRMKYE
ncbi:hypothetical protein [Clostridium sp. DL1XJH146]